LETTFQAANLEIKLKLKNYELQCHLNNFKNQTKVINDFVLNKLNNLYDNKKKEMIRKSIQKTMVLMGSELKGLLE
jgi:hypothetical protein